MKKLLLLLGSILTISSQAQNPDPNFDNPWVVNTNYPAPEPLGWITTNVLTNSFASSSNPISVTQSTMNCSGPSSMRVETKKYTLGLLNGFLPDTCGFAFTGTVTISLSGGRLVEGFPYNQRPTQINYCYHALPMALDTCGVSVLLWKWNGTSRTIIGGAKNLYPVATTSMTNASLNIAYTNTLTPDSMCIYVSSSYKFPTTGTALRKGAKLGSVIYADNFVYPSSTVGLKENNVSQIELRVYPNPANNSLYVSTESTDAKTIEIVDLTGKTIETTTFNDGRLKLDVSKYNTGLYIYRVTGANKQSLKTGKFTVTH